MIVLGPTVDNLGVIVNYRRFLLSLELSGVDPNTFCPHASAK